MTEVIVFIDTRLGWDNVVGIYEYSEELLAKSKEKYADRDYIVVDTHRLWSLKDLEEVAKRPA